MKLSLGIGVALAVLTSAGAQDMGKQDAPKPCDLKSIEKGKWCEECKCLCDKDTCPLDEDGNCKKCGKTPKDVEVCVKTVYSCGCGKKSIKEAEC